MLTILLISVLAQTDLPAAKPVPRMQVLPLPRDEASGTRDSQESSRECFGKDLYRPFLYPMIGPSSRSLTRMGHPHDPNTHSHHTSVWISPPAACGIQFSYDA